MRLFKRGLFFKKSINALQLLLLVTVAVTHSQRSPKHVLDLFPMRNSANLTYATENLNPSGLASIFSPRMDFDQWKPLTGRGDPLRNDPTYDYEPPVLERVHYWADDAKTQHNPEKKNEVLMLGISSRKPSITSRPPSPPPSRRPQLKPTPPKYEDFTYKLSEHYPMTILVPPPPPPPGHQPQLFILTDDKLSPNHQLTSHIKLTSPPKLSVPNTTQLPGILTTEYALQEANLIYQSSTTNQHWVVGVNDTKYMVNNAVSSDYAGWGPTTPIEEIDSENDTHNVILKEHIKLVSQPYLFYKPTLSESSLPPSVTTSTLPTFLPTVLPPIHTAEKISVAFTPVTRPTEVSTFETTTDTTDNHEYYEETTTESQTTLLSQPTTVSYDQNAKPNPEVSIFDMLGPMMSMPLINGPERPEDNLYAHASENKPIIHKQRIEEIKLETMQTMQPPPPHYKFTGSTLAPKENSHVFTHDPYLNMRYTTPSPITASKNSEYFKSTSEVPMYLIIQGHSKVKTYSSKQKLTDNDHTINNEIPKPNETNEVKHLHPIKDKNIKKSSDINRTSRFQNLKSLVDNGLGSIEIQEADIGIKYDVSDGSEVPLEVYRKGVVDSGENNNYSSKELRPKREISLDDFLPFDADSIQEYVYSFLKGKRNETSLTGLIAQAFTSDTSAAVDDLTDDDNNNVSEDEDR